MKKLTFSDALMTDIQVGTSKHDEIVLWCFDNARTLVDDVFKMNDYNIESIEIEKPVKFNNTIIAFLDLCINLKHKDHPITEYVIIEVKSKIETLGELLRQIQFYKTHCYGKYLVVSPDVEKFTSILSTQNISSYKYPIEDTTFDIF